MSTKVKKLPIHAIGGLHKMTDSPNAFPPSNNGKPGSKAHGRFSPPRWLT